MRVYVFKTDCYESHDFAVVGEDNLFKVVRAKTGKPCDNWYELKKILETTDFKKADDYMSTFYTLEEYEILDL